MILDRVRVRVPASTANLGPGFDTLGMALNLYAHIEIKASDHTTITMHGDQLQGIAADKTNLVYQVAQMVFEEAGVSCPELEIVMESDIPLTRGLGSSAAAIVGGIVAANALIGNKLSDDQLFQIATRLEDHPDNVGASLFGGIVAAFWDGKRAEMIRIEPHEHLEVLVAIPEFHLSTDKARNVLPSEYNRRDTVFNLGHCALLVAALSSGNLEMIRHAMQDRLHQPYRSALIPGMTQILEHATDYGALGVALSGAGPTMLALVDARSTEKDQLEFFLHDAFQKENVAATTMWLKPCREGVRVLTSPDGHSKLDQKFEGEVRA